MITIEEGQRLMARFIELRNAAESNDPKDVRAFKEYERSCIEKFAYLITMHAGRYKVFHNYDDINQEGLIALTKAMKTYDPTKGVFFYWAHKYIGTRVSRVANLHTAIRFPLKFARSHPPHRENKIPIMLDENSSPELLTEQAETDDMINRAIECLDTAQAEAIKLAFGFNGERPLPLKTICKRMNMSRVRCILTISDAMNILQDSIRI